MDVVELTIVPDEDDPPGARVLVDGVVDGRPHVFLLDTGAAVTTLAYDSQTANFVVSGTRRAAGVFGQEEEPMVTVPQLEIGSIVRHNLPAARLPRSAAGADSILGLDVLADRCWEFRFEAAFAVIHPAGEPLGNELPEPLRMDSKRHPYLHVGVGGVSAEALFDTGASVTLVDERLVRQTPESFRPLGQSLGTDVVGSSQETATYRMDGLRLGGAVFPPHKVAALDLSDVNARVERPMDMILGYTTLQLADWIIDFPAGRWWLVRYPSGSQ
jgi:predicted aspartyl protease